VEDLDWNELSQKVLEPSIKKPLHIRFVITCLDASCNVDTCLTVRGAAIRLSGNFIFHLPDGAWRSHPLVWQLHLSRV
jgi:hypothetical protein